MTREVTRFESETCYDLRVRSLLAAQVDPAVVVQVSSVLEAVEIEQVNRKLILAHPVEFRLKISLLRNVQKNWSLLPEQHDR